MRIWPWRAWNVCTQEVTHRDGTLSPEHFGDVSLLSGRPVRERANLSVRRMTWKDLSQQRCLRDCRELILHTRSRPSFRWEWN